MKRISMTYGQVLFELGIKKESLQKAQDMLHENEELLSALENPTITKKEKENVVEKLFSDDIKSFLKVVCDNDDIACFDEAVEYYDELKRKTDKIIKAEFDYVTMPKDEQLERIKQYLMKQYQADKVELTLKEEKDLIGGFVLKVGDHVYDNSLSGAQVRCESRKGEPMRFYCHEVVQRWISPDGKVTDMALLRGFLFCYCDVWALGSDMEVRPHNSLYDDVVARSCAYPKMRILPQLRRNGFKGDFHGISPVRLFKALLSDPRIETLMKGGEIEVMKHFLFNTRTADECWASYLIAKRHKYQIDNLSMWCDYLRMLKKLGQDLRNPKNICPEDFMAAHDNATRKIEAIHEKERAAEQRRWEIERREREQQRQLQRKKDAEDFIANKSKFFGLVITDEEIIVKVLESIDEYYNEGKTQGICVFGSGYYKKADTLILSARIGDEIIETVEVDLRTLEVVQCHGKHNQDTEYHERIIDLVNKNANLIRERMKAA